MVFEGMELINNDYAVLAFSVGLLDEKYNKACLCSFYMSGWKLLLLKKRVLTLLFYDLREVTSSYIEAEIFSHKYAIAKGNRILIAF